MSQHFVIQELVPPATFSRFGERAWWFLDPKIIAVLDALQEELGAERKIVVNSWHQRGQFQFSGFRPPDTTVGAALSQHRFGRAADVKVQGMTPAQVLQVILAQKEKYIALGLTTIENIAKTPTWLHLDVRPRLPHMPADDFLYVDP